MKKIEITIRDIKEIKKLMNKVDQLKENNYTLTEDYGFNYNGKEPLIEHKESKIERNIKIASMLLKVSYDVIVDMCYDLSFANDVLESINAKAA